MAIDVSTTAAPPGTPAFTAATEPEFDERWAAWKARGAAHHRAARLKVSIFAPILLVVVAVFLYTLGR